MAPCSLPRPGTLRIIYWRRWGRHPLARPAAAQILARVLTTILAWSTIYKVQSPTRSSVSRKSRFSIDPLWSFCRAVNGTRAHRVGKAASERSCIIAGFGGNVHASSIEHRASVGLFIGRDLRTSAKQNKALWADWDAFLGTWQGTGNGEPTQGRGEFSFAPELQGAVLVRHNFAEYPASKDRPAYRHDDLMVIYPGADYQKPRA